MIFWDKLYSLQRRLGYPIISSDSFAGATNQFKISYIGVNLSKSMNQLKVYLSPDYAVIDSCGRNQLFNMLHEQLEAFGLSADYLNNDNGFNILDYSFKYCVDTQHRSMRYTLRFDSELDYSLAEQYLTDIGWGRYLPEVYYNASVAHDVLGYNICQWYATGAEFSNEGIQCIKNYFGVWPNHYMDDWSMSYHHVNDHALLDELILRLGFQDELLINYCYAFLSDYGMFISFYGVDHTEDNKRISKIYFQAPQELDINQLIDTLQVISCNADLYNTNELLELEGFRLDGLAIAFETEGNSSMKLYYRILP